MDNQNKFDQWGRAKAEKKEIDGGSNYALEGMGVGLLAGVAMWLTGLFAAPVMSMGFGVAIGMIVGRQIKRKSKKAKEAVAEENESNRDDS